MDLGKCSQKLHVTTAGINWGVGEVATFKKQVIYTLGLPCWLSGKEFTCSAGETGSTPGSGRSPREGNGDPLQYSCLGNHLDRGASWVTVHGVTKSQT